MSRESFPLDELLRLLGELTDGQLAEDGRLRLNELLRDNPQAQGFYRQYMDLHARLHMEYASGASAGHMPGLPGMPDSPERPPGKPKRLRWRWAWPAAAVVLLGCTLTLTLWLLTGPLWAVDPRNPGYEFQYRLYPPQGFSVKKSKAVMRPDPRQPKAAPIIGADGKFTELGQWYYALGSDPQAFAKWWRGYWSDTNNWVQRKTPVYAGSNAVNQGHRIVGWLGTFKQLMDGDPQIAPGVKQALMNENWKYAVEQIIAQAIDERGWLKSGPNEAAMAQIFHFLRTKFGAMGLSVPNIYTIDRAQNLICTLLTEPWVICEEDRYLAPPDLDYLEGMGKQHGSATGDVRIVKDGKVLFTGGLFIGWKDKPSLHGTWDALSIINSLFKYYPDPDPASPKSIFYKWNRLPEEKKRVGRNTIILCSRRLWLDWQEHKGKTWCWVYGGSPTDDYTRASEAPFLPAYDGYGDNQLGWAKQCWEEMFGDPMRNTNDGVQALLAIAHGKVHRVLKTPVGQQAPGRYDFDPAVQQRRLAEDLQKLKSAAPKLADEEPKLDPAKSKGVSE